MKFKCFSKLWRISNSSCFYTNNLILEIYSTNWIVDRCLMIQIQKSYKKKQQYFNPINWRFAEIPLLNITIHHYFQNYQFFFVITINIIFVHWREQRPVVELTFCSISPDHCIAPVFCNSPFISTFTRAKKKLIKNN